jgi:hypothetical protein
MIGPSKRRRCVNGTNKSQRDYSGSSRKRKPDDLIVAMDHPPRGKKTTTQEQFEKLLQKKCPWHPGANHAAIDCYNLRRTFSNPSNGKKNKSTDKEPKEDDQGDKSHNAKFQDASKTINIIFRGDEEFSSRREQKTTTPRNHVRRAGGTTTTPMVGGSHLVLTR